MVNVDFFNSLDEKTRNNYIILENTDVIESLPDNKFAFKVRNAKNPEIYKDYKEMTIEEYEEFLSCLEDILDKEIYARLFDGEERIISMMRTVNILRMADAYFGMQTKIDYRKLEKHIIDNKLQKEYVKYLKEHQFQGYVLAGLLESGTIQNLVKDRKTFDIITTNVNFVELITGTDTVDSMLNSNIVIDLYKRKLISEDVIIDLYKANLIDRQRVRETLEVKSIVGLYMNTKSGDEKGMTKETFLSLIDDQDLFALFKTSKSFRYLHLIAPENIIDRYIKDNIAVNQSESSDDKRKKIGMNVLQKATNVNAETIIEYFYSLPNRDDIRPEHVVQFLLQNGLPEWLIPNGQDLYEIHEEGILVGKDMLELAKGSILDDKTLLEVYIRQEKLKEIYKSKQLFSDKGDITAEEFVGYFTSKKSLEMMNDKTTRKRFIEQYKKVLSSLENEKRLDVEKSLVEQIYSQNKGDEARSLLETLKLFNGEILTNPESFRDKVDIDEIVELLKREDLLEELTGKQGQSQEDKIDDMISKLYKAKLIDIEALCLIYLEDDKYKDDEDAFQGKLLEQYIKDNLDEEVFPYIDKKTLKLFIQDDRILPNKLLDMFEHGIIDIDLVKEANIEDISQYIVDGYPEDKLAELYVNEILTFEGLKDLNERGIVPGDWNEVRKRYNGLIDIEKAMIELITQGTDIENNAEDEPSEREKTQLGSKGVNKNGLYKTTISSDAREEFFDAVGCIRYGYVENGIAYRFTKAQKESLSLEEQEKLEEHELKRVIIGKGSLNGYEIIPLPELDITIIENKKEENATYVMNFCSSIEKMHNESKQSFRADRTAIPVPHTKYWGAKIISAIAEINGFDKKELLKRYDAAIVKTVEDYELNKEIRDEEKRTREEGK